MGRLEFGFANAKVFLDADASVLDSDLCTRMLSGLTTITRATCIRETYHPEAKYGAYRITLESFPSFPPQMNNLLQHNGNPPIDMFYCEVRQVNAELAIGAYCRVSDVIAEGIPGKSNTKLLKKKWKDLNSADGGPFFFSWFVRWLVIFLL